MAQLHALIADHLGEDDEPGSVLVGIESDRGPWVQALIATGYLVYALNPLQVARYRERHVTSGAKSDPGDAHVLAEVVRTDRAHHRPVAGDSEQAAVIKTLARAHQSMIWIRQRQSNQLRSTLREFHPAALLAVGDDLAGRDALAVPTRPRCHPRRPGACRVRRRGRPLHRREGRRNYAGTSPITKASGRRRVVLARYARNRRLGDALHQQAFAALTASPGARAFYDHHRARGATHHQALRALANRLVGILDGCLRHHTTYHETIAWAHHQTATAA